MITSQALFRLSGAAAIAGGLMRIAAAFPLPLGEVNLQWVYTIIDVLLLFGVIGIYLARAKALGFLGLAAFALAVSALSFIGGPDADPFGFSTYQEGAVTLAIAMAGLSLAWVRTGQKPLTPAGCWFSSIIAGGLFGYLPMPLPDYALPAAGVLFGAGFALAGLDLLRRGA